ncbi:hypothetical protein HCN44_010781 [Aphidius gifuensis]|uniref:Uncharacterized protein n=1 Tax=Aphidius gifuensis TaxID=684658 RepID=A0A834XR79_APHGI|nr:hypothetical protein HCN44_010781 [Aphidius gifuensis]
MEHQREILGHSLFIENPTLLESSQLRPCSVIAQGSTPAPIEHVVNNDKTECSKSRGKIRLAKPTRMNESDIDIPIKSSSDQKQFKV